MRRVHAAEQRAARGDEIVVQRAIRLISLIGPRAAKQRYKIAPKATGVGNSRGSECDVAPAGEQRSLRNGGAGHLYAARRTSCPSDETPDAGIGKLVGVRVAVEDVIRHVRREIP